ncbi:lysine biosynthesis protein LysW [Saccharothrix longispora]|uniref:Alpha-aminoadipate carrier protein LysW n=1 Tax=Saccharothrix longispora TaxID=33920 RepID=A0ABU1PTN3_9PSEU|nr:lysine biosynthesis protein LysW [Saccharothrix longispora]MDR6594001.1 alpha-aminoadipate carrier protein LysW [Saccharothrix longispora]
MAATACPECEGSVELAESLTQNEILECPDCLSELEVVTTNPPVLALAPEMAEDWGE